MGLRHPVTYGVYPHVWVSVIHSLSYTHIAGNVCVLCVEQTPTHVGIHYTISRCIFEKRKHEDVLWERESESKGDTRI